MEKKKKKKGRLECPNGFSQYLLVTIIKYRIWVLHTTVPHKDRLRPVD